MENMIIVCPFEEKFKILTKLNNLEKKALLDIKFMTKDEYLKNYYFNYDEKTIYYLMKNYNYNIDVAKVYLSNLYIIDEFKNYKNEKLQFLKKLKIELKENQLLYYNYNFKNYLKKRIVKVINYFSLEKYEEKALNYKADLSCKPLVENVVECETIEEEINYVCIKIIQLIEQGVDINKIFLTNVSNDYFYIIEKLFNFYNIPINLDFKDTIFSTKIVADYFKTRKIDDINKDNNLINKSLIKILNSVNELDEDNFKDKIIVDKLKKTYIENKKFKNAVNIKNLYEESFTSDEYVFVIGFNQDSLPKIKKDIEFIDDDCKNEVELYSTSYLNKREKDIVLFLLSRIKNLFLSYKLTSPFSTYYRSSLIDEVNLKIVKPNLDNYQYSNVYNKIRLAEKLDKYYLYREKDYYLEKLLGYYKIPYKEYSNKFTGIDNDIYLKNLDYPLRLSYTSLNNYCECKFKYYLKNVLKLDSFEETFSSFIGNMFHKMLSLFKKSDFNLELEYKNFLDNRELSLKEKILLIRIKNELIKLIDVLKKQQLLTGYNEEMFEAKAIVPIDKSVAVEFVGYIDKIMFYSNVDDTYFSIVDYKTGFIDTHIEAMKYGLHMQLPIYLYLIHYSKLFSNPIFTGIYYQNILFNYPSWSPKLESESKYFLNGYSTDDFSILSRFDSTCENSELIKSMKYSEDKGFGTYSKLISNDTLYNMLKFTKKHIEERCDEIINGDFSINPKVYALNNVSCTYCPFNDICFMKDDNLIYLEKVDNLDFLGDDE